MNKFNKIISMLLAVFMIMSAFTSLTAIGALAADDSSSSSSGDSGSSGGAASSEEDPYLTAIYASPEDKLKTMTLMVEKDGFQLYVDDYSGEVACVNTITGEKLFTNPYDLGISTGNSTTKEEIISQIVLNFSLVTRPGETQTFTSYKEAVKRNQINVEKIKDGVRVEYTLGREQSKSLVPKLITKERFDEIFLSKFMEKFPNGELYEDPKNATLEAKDVQKFLTRYVLYSMDPVEMSKDDRNLFGYVSDNLNQSDRDRARVIKDYPVVSRTAVYVFDPKASEVEIEECEKIIELYCPEYTYEELEWDHALTDYEADDQTPPVFRLALEYKISDGALDVRLPANGIRFNESLYTLNSIEVLPYMGAGNSAYSGFNFFPDGSGAIFDFEQLNTSTSRTVKADVYGVDYAYHDITGRYQKPIRYPVFGIVEETVSYTYTRYDNNMNEVVAENTLSGAIVDTVKAYNKDKTDTLNICKGNEKALNDFIVYQYEGKSTTEDINCAGVIYDSHTIEEKNEDKRGFVAIIEEGDALASLTTYHAGSLSDYNTIKMSITPRPKDAYVLKDSLSVSNSGDSKVHITCPRKYTDSYRLKYILLTDTDETEFKMPDGMTISDVDNYDTSWMGMAVAYREYLYENNVLTKLSSDDIIENNIPLYIETFGAVETTKKILSVPVNVMESLTTFDQIVEMYDHLSGQGINNINFKLTGFANGGMQYQVPGNLKFERVVGGNKGFQELLDKAAEINADDNKNMGIFPDFDMVYQLEDGMFDKYSQFEHAAKTIDDRYASKREYSPTQQKQVNYYNIVISPAYFYVIYNALEKNYADKYDNVIGISVSTLGQWLNSDFDEDEPYNREDSKQFTIEAFEHLDETYGEVMTDGGNAYVWKYSDHILNVPLDSSRYIFSASAVPFVGVVLHGSLKFAGEPLNMEGDMQYAILKAIENGASPYFILCMDNTEILKEHSDLSKYYSVRYDIWKDDISGVYNTLNGVLGDVQDKYIIGHETIAGGVRIPDADELEIDIYSDFLKDIENEENAFQVKELEKKLAASTARKNGKLAEQYALANFASLTQNYKNYMLIASETVAFDETFYNNMKAAAIKEYLAMASAIARDSENYMSDAKYKDAQAISKAVMKYNFDPMIIYDADNNLKLYEDDYLNALDKINKAATEEERQAAVEAFETSENVRLYCRAKAVAAAKQLVVTENKYNDFNKALDVYTNAYLYAFDESDEYEKAVNKIENANLSSNTENKRYVERYVNYVARTHALEELGYDKLDNDKISEEYVGKTQQVIQYYNEAKNQVAELVDVDYQQIIKSYEEMVKYKELVIEGVFVLAEVENVTLEYADGKEGDVRYITNFDEIQSTIVKEAIERAWLIISYFEEENYLVNSSKKAETTTDEKYTGEVVKRLFGGTLVRYDEGADVYFSVVESYGSYTYTFYNKVGCIQEFYDYASANSEDLQKKSYAMVGVFSETFYDDVQRKIAINNRDIAEAEEVEEEDSRYATGNIVAVTYGSDAATPYKTIILNYNNYTVRIVYEGKEYTIPAHEFVEIKK